MVAIKLNDIYYIAYKQNEKGNPHEKGYPCLVDTTSGKIAENQRKVLKTFMKNNELDYHTISRIKEKDLNTYDLVNFVIKFHDKNVI